VENHFAQEIQLNPFTLRFEGSIEADFQEDYFHKSLKQLRFGLILALILFPLFGVLDYLLIPDVLREIWIIRYAIACPAIALYLLFTWSPAIKQVYQPSIVLIILVMGGCIIAMTAIAYPPGSYYYYAGLILVLMWGYASGTARFLYATFAGWVIVAAYQVVAIGYADTALAVLISNNFFFISANIIGMVACHQIELYKRREFWQRQAIDAERMKSEELLQNLHNELALASEIQSGLLPEKSFTWEKGEISCFSKPTLEIGGDFYRYRIGDQGEVILAVGDVSGHGIPAALLMAATLSLFDTSFSRELSPCERMVLLDEELSAYTESRHQNCAFCYLEMRQERLKVVNAGGIPPFVRKANGEVIKVNATGFPLGHGIAAELGYLDEEICLYPGEMVIALSDGAIESQSTDHAMYGFQRLQRAIASGPAASAQAMLEHLIGDVMGYIDASLPQDDFTIVVMKVREPSKA
jgi:serine phosphatase RsbU (regulator of sigma subunit)